MNAARFTGAGLGLLALLLVLVSARPEAREPDLGARLSIGMTAPGVIDVSPEDPRPVVSDPGLVDGRSPVEGRAVIYNRGSEPVAIRLGVSGEGVADFGRLAKVLRLRITSDQGLLAFVGIYDLVAGSAPVVLGVGESVPIAIEAWIPEGTPDDYHGELVEADLEIRTEDPGSGIG